MQTIGRLEAFQMQSSLRELSLPAKGLGKQTSIQYVFATECRELILIKVLCLVAANMAN